MLHPWVTLRCFGFCVLLAPISLSLIRFALFCIVMYCLFIIIIIIIFFLLLLLFLFFFFFFLFLFLFPFSSLLYSYVIV
jgi:hypothetical protein